MNILVFPRLGEHEGEVSPQSAKPFWRWFEYEGVWMDVVVQACNPATWRLGLGSWRLRDCLRIGALHCAMLDGTEQPAYMVAPDPGYQVRPDQICDVLQVSCKTCTNLFMVECQRLNRFSPPGSPGEEGAWIWTPSRTKNKTFQRVDELLVS